MSPARTLSGARFYFDTNIKRRAVAFWVQLAVLVVSVLVAQALAPKPPSPKPAGIGDFQVPTATEDKAIPVVFGKVWITGPNVVWYGNLFYEKIKKKGGKK